MCSYYCSQPRDYCLIQDSQLIPNFSRSDVKEDFDHSLGERHSQRFLIINFSSCKILYTDNSKMGLRTRPSYIPSELTLLKRKNMCARRVLTSGVLRTALR